MLDIQHLRYFFSVVDMGSLSKAAGALSISQPSVSERVCAMGYQLGVPLLLRSAAGVSPTDAGLTLYRHARIVIRQMQEMEVDVVSEGGGAVGQVAVGLPTSIAAVLAVPLVERLALDHPGIRFKLFEGLGAFLFDLFCN